MKKAATPTTTAGFLEVLVQGSMDSVEGVLQVCRTIRTAKENLPESEFKDLRDRWGKGEKVWSKLLQIGLDDRLEAIKEHLPPSYTTIHQVHCLNDEELKEAVDSGALHPGVSQGVLKRWLKEYRFVGTQEAVPSDFSPIATVLGPSGLDPEHLERFKGDLEKLVTTYGFKTMHHEDQSTTALRLRRNKDRSYEMVGTLLKDLKSTYNDAPDNLKTLFDLKSLEDLIQGPMSYFTGFLHRVRGGRDGFWTFHAHDYIHKIALEYLKTDSRGQRFNYRRRLRGVAQQHPHLAKKVQMTVEDWMKY